MKFLYILPALFLVACTGGVSPFPEESVIVEDELFELTQIKECVVVDGSDEIGLGIACEGARECLDAARDLFEVDSISVKCAQSEWVNLNTDSGRVSCTSDNDCRNALCETGCSSEMLDFVDKVTVSCHQNVCKTAAGFQEMYLLGSIASFTS